MSLSTEDITIRIFPTTKQGGVTKPGFRLYYYQGNFYWQVFTSREREVQITFLIKKFIENNKELVERDRSSPDYRSWLEIVNEAFA